MDDLQRELSALKHGLAQLERGNLFKPLAGVNHVDALAPLKATYRRRIAFLQRLTQMQPPSQNGS